MRFGTSCGGPLQRGKRFIFSEWIFWTNSVCHRRHRISSDLDMTYKHLIKVRDIYRNACKKLPTAENKSLLRLAHINAFARSTKTSWINFATSIFGLQKTNHDLHWRHRRNVQTTGQYLRWKSITDLHSFMDWLQGFFLLGRGAKCNRFHQIKIWAWPNGINSCFHKI